MDITSSVDIDRPAAEVFDYVADFANNPTWQGGMKRCTWLTEPPIGVGSRYEQEAAMMGRPIVSTFEVTGFEPGRSISIATIESTFPIRVTRTVEELADGRSRVTAHVGGGPTGPLARVGTPLMKKLVKRSVDGDYARLKQVLEAS